MGCFFVFVFSLSSYAQLSLHPKIPHASYYLGFSKAKGISATSHSFVISSGYTEVGFGVSLPENSKDKVYALSLAIALSKQDKKFLPAVNAGLTMLPNKSFFSMGLSFAGVLYQDEFRKIMPELGILYSFSSTEDIETMSRFDSIIMWNASFYGAVNFATGEGSGPYFAISPGIQVASKQVVFMASIGISVKFLKDEIDKF